MALTLAIRSASGTARVRSCPSKLDSIVSSAWARNISLSKETPLPPIWAGNCALLGTRDECGQIVSLTPQSGVALDALCKRDYKLLDLVFKEAVRQQAGIDLNSREWIFLRRLFRPSGVRDVESIPSELAVLSLTEQRAITACLKQYQHVDLPMLFEAEAFIGHGTDLFLQAFFGKHWGCLLYFASPDPNNELRRLDKSMGAEVAATDRAGVAVSDLQLARVELALDMFNSALRRDSDLAYSIGNLFAQMASAPGAERISPLGISWAELTSELAWVLRTTGLHHAMESAPEIAQHPLNSYLADQHRANRLGFGCFGTRARLANWVRVQPGADSVIRRTRDAITNALIENYPSIPGDPSLCTVINAILSGDITIGRQEQFCSNLLHFYAAIDKTINEVGREPCLVRFLQETVLEADTVVGDSPLQDSPQTPTIQLVGEGRARLLRAALLVKYGVCTLANLSR